ncbi:MAG: tetratricopeptide repeat protein [Verrucomicrobiota bacterium]
MINSTSFWDAHYGYRAIAGIVSCDADGKSRGKAQIYCGQLGFALRLQRLKRHSQKPKRSRPPTTPPEPERPISPRRLWLFRFIALLLPLFLLALLEFGLRLCGYGYSTSFFKEERVGDQTMLINNDTFTLRFFPPELARWPSSLAMEKVKAADTCRIFILGESAAMGDPQPSFGAGRYLEVLLRERFPGKKFEIVNVGITAINSHVILPIARACAEQQGDIWIIYMGNNEMVGPFGAATIFGSRAPPLAAVRLNLALQSTRIGQLFVSGMRKLGGKSKNASWGGMRMFMQNQIPPSDRRRETVYKNFAGNLRDIVDVGIDSGAKVILNTMSVNLRDCPPFASLSNSNLPTADRAQFEKLYAEGLSLEKQSNFVNAAQSFEQAAKIDPQFAELQFRWANCLLLATNPAARQHFQLACDTDALPFRADSRINTIIRDVAKKSASSQLILNEAELKLQTQSSAKISGDESFFEHVHFNPEGNYRLGKSWAEEVERLLPDARKLSGTNNWSPQEICDRQLGLSDWNRAFLLDSVIARMNQPPLNQQYNIASRREAHQNQLRKLRQQQAEPGAVARVRGEFEAAIARAPRDTFLHESFGNFLEATGDRKMATEEYRKINEQLPHDFYSALQAGRLLGELGKSMEGEVFLSRAVKLRPNLPEGWAELGTVTAAQGQFSVALGHYDRAVQLRPSDPNYLCYKGQVLAKLNRQNEAMQLYRQAIQLRRDFWEAHFSLAGELAAVSQINESMREYAEVLRINPRHEIARLNLGVMLVRQNRLDEAIGQFEAVLQITPTNRIAQDYLQQVKARKSQTH